MQFALPPRKNHVPSSYARSSRVVSLPRRKQLKTIAILGFIICSITFLISQLSASGTGSGIISTGTASVVIVTVLDRENYSQRYVQKIVRNREEYALRHGYTNFFANVSDYEPLLNDAPRSWAIVPAVRHAMAKHADSTYFFHLSPHALIMNPSISLKSHLFDKKRLESLMLRATPVVPPDSIIKTFSHLKSDDIDLILTQDKEDVSAGSFVLRNGDFARFFLDLWFDPLYRSYNFAKAETHALDHIVQWHPTLLARLALVPQRTFNAYSKDSSIAGINGTYQDGDFILRISGCDTDPKRSCEKEFEPYYTAWERQLKSE